MITKTYTMQGKVDLTISMNYFGLSLDNVVATGADELAIYGATGEDGEYACWDASAEFKEDGSIVLSGSDGPSGGTHTVNIVLVVPFNKIGKVTMENTVKELLNLLAAEHGYIDHVVATKILTEAITQEGKFPALMDLEAFVQGVDGEIPENMMEDYPILNSALHYLAVGEVLTGFPNWDTYN